MPKEDAAQPLLLKLATAVVALSIVDMAREKLIRAYREITAADKTTKEIKDKLSALENLLGTMIQLFGQFERYVPAINVSRKLTSLSQLWRDVKPSDPTLKQLVFVLSGLQFAKGMHLFYQLYGLINAARENKPVNLKPWVYSYLFFRRDYIIQALSSVYTGNTALGFRRSGTLN